MKLILVILVAVAQAQHFPGLDTRQVEKYIRARGTTALSAVRLDESVQDKDRGQEWEDMTYTQKQAKLLMEGTAREDSSVNLFDNPKIEVPDLCLPQRHFLSTEEYASLAYSGVALQKCWVSGAGGDPENYKYNDMPLLNNQQLAAFYDCATQGQVVTTPHQAKSLPENILLVVNYGDIYRQDISWLETMVYICTKGQQVDQRQYMAEPDSLYDQVLGSLERQDAQRGAREQAMQDRMVHQVATKQLARTKAFHFDPFRIPKRAKRSKALSRLAPSLQKVLKDILRISRSKKFLRRVRQLRGGQEKRKKGRRLRRRRHV